VFRNTGKTTTIQVGFVSPPPSQEYDEEDPTYPPPISWVWTTVNDRPVTVRTERMGKSRASEDRHVYPFDWVFLSKITFRKGLTRVKHRYKFQCGASVLAPVHIPYRLTTGTNWQGGVIDTFRLVVDVGERRLVGVPPTFTGEIAETLPWKATGRATRVDSVGYRFEFPGEPPIYDIVFAVETGQLVLEQLGFRPTDNLVVVVHDGRSIIERIVASSDRAWVRQLSCIELEHVLTWYHDLLPEHIDEVDREIEAFVRSIYAERCR
jgi:hypothetical protein